ncbi:MAG: di-trans,poly-cis-decaprenylcistransferase [Planctomycetota bacterium]|nr:MAG: di-trans,poly-cis-decaprenylcistransferase [Planctomycetota bacterium]
MDGNGRWAQRHGWRRIRGHESGVEAVRDTVEAAAEWGIEHLTLYSFSIENWQRPRSEVNALMALLRRFLVEERPTLLDNGIRLRALGRVQDLPADAAEVLRETEALTAAGDRMTLRLALSYGGRRELVEAARRLAERVAAGELAPAEVDEAAFAGALYDPEMPDPDLVIRTAGEQRLSNFLLWQASYAELHFAPELWPDFRRRHLLRALRDYHGRERRFGRVPGAGSADSN